MRAVGSWLLRNGVTLLLALSAVVFVTYREATANGEPLSPKAAWEVIILASVMARLVSR